MKTYILILSYLLFANLSAQNIATISGNSVIINNNALTAEINGGRMTSLNLIGQPNLLNNGGSGYFSIVDNDGFFSPTTLIPNVKINTSEIADIYFQHINNLNTEMHYVFRNNEKGFFTYFVISDAELADKTLNSVRFATRVDKNIFDYAWTSEREGEMVHPDVLTNYVEEIQDATYLLQDSSIYTKYDWAVYKIYDQLHGLMGNEAGIWNIDASQESHNGGPTMQELTLHGTSTTPILLSQFFSAHYGSEIIVLKNEYKTWSKLFGPQFIYLNSGTNEEMITDAKSKTDELLSQWPYKWINQELFPLNRGSLSGSLQMNGQGNVDSAMVFLCKSGPSWLLNNDHWQWQPYNYMFWTEADESGNFEINNIRPGTYTLYAFTQKGKLIDELRSDNIFITEGTNEAGIIEWDANDKQKTIFQIGTADHKSSEFKLADLPRQYGRWKDCPYKLTYNIATDTPRNNWYYCQRVNSNWSIKFDIDNLYDLESPQLKIALSGVDARPHLDAIINGTTISTKDLNTDSGIRRSSLTGGKYVFISTPFDKNILKEGSNELVMKCYGSAHEYKGIMYDAILLEADTKDAISINRSTLENNNIYPNPINKSITIKSDKNIKSVEIIDIHGRIVYSNTISKLTKTITISTNNYTPGTYIAKVMDDIGINYLKLQKN